MDFIKPAIACFTWRIPKHSKYEICLLSHGYIKQQLRAINSKSISIPDEITQLLSLYSQDDDTILTNMKTGSTDIIPKHFSDIFSYQSLNLRLAVSWRENKEEKVTCDEEEEDEEKDTIVDKSKFTLDYTIEMVAIPKKKYSSIDMDVTIQTIELNSSVTQECEFQTWCEWSTMSTPIKIDHIKDLETLTVKLYIHEFVAWDPKEDIICMEQAKDKRFVMDLNAFELGPYIFSWDATIDKPIYQIKKFRACQSMESAVFIYKNMKWCIKLTPFNNSNYGKFEDFNINICALSIPNNIDKIYVYHRVFINGQLISDKCGDYTNDSNWDYISFDQDKPIDIHDLERLNIVLELMVLHMFDENGAEVVAETKVVEVDIYPVQSYEWKMKLENLDEIEYNDSFKSNIFGLFGFKWICEFFPREECEDDLCPLDDYARFRIHLCGLPCHVSRIGLKYTLKLLETDTIYTSIDLLPLKEKTYYQQWCIHQLQTDKLKDLNNSQLTFVIDIQLYHVFDKDDNDITSKYLYIKPAEETQDTELLPAADCKWQVKDKQLVESMKEASNWMQFISPIFELFGCKFYFVLVPSKRNFFSFDAWSVLRIHLLSLPEGIERIVVYAELQNNTLQDFAKRVRWFDEQKNMIMETYNWNKGTNMMKEAKVNQLSFCIKMSLIDVIDQNGKYVTNEYISKDDEKKGELGSIINGLLKGTQEFIWRIGIFEGLDNMKHVNVEQFFESEYYDIFGLKFKIRWYPNGRIEKDKNTQRLSIDICIESLPDDIDNNKNNKIFIFCKVVFVEKDNFALSHIIDIADMDNVDIDVDKDCYSIVINDDNNFKDGLDPFDIQDLNQVTFKLQLAMIP